jgi:hypothetical protein
LHHPLSVELDVDLHHRVSLRVVDAPDAIGIGEAAHVSRVLEVIDGNG